MFKNSMNVNGATVTKNIRSLQMYTKNLFEKRMFKKWYIKMLQK